MRPGRLALLLIGIGAICVVIGIAAPAVRELFVVTGVFFVLLAGGVLNWDKRGGH
jgi:hypothetical protein